MCHLRAKLGLLHLPGSHVAEHKCLVKDITLYFFVVVVEYKEYTCNRCTTGNLKYQRLMSAHTAGGTEGVSLFVMGA